MEEKNKEIKEIIFNPENVEITYETDVKEIITKDYEGYKKLYDGWLLEEPIFISDIYKNEMRDLFFAAKNRNLSIMQLNNFLTEDNREEATKFIKYMRKRNYTEERKKWIKKQ